MVQRRHKVQSMRWKMKATITAGVVTVILMMGTIAKASTSSDVALLLTQVVDSSIEGAPEEVAFWWQGQEVPLWTESDTPVMEALDRSGVSVATPERVEVSRIYRRPGLSTSNGAQLGTLLEVDRVLVGQVEYRPIEGQPPLHYPGIEARATVDLVPAGDSEGLSMERFEVTRRVYGRDFEALWPQATEELGQALGEAMGHHLRRTGAEVGAGSGDHAIVVRNVERAQHLETLREVLQGVGAVDSVRPRWVSEGIIALGLEPQEGTSEARARADAMAALEGGEFEGFELRFESSSDVSEHGEIWLEPQGGVSF